MEGWDRLAIGGRVFISDANAGHAFRSRHDRYSPHCITGCRVLERYRPAAAIATPGAGIGNKPEGRTH